MARLVVIDATFWAAVGALATTVAALATTVYAILVLVTLREMQEQRLDGARPIVTFDLRGMTRGGVDLTATVAISNIGQAAALDARLVLAMPALSFRGEEGPINLAAGTELEYRFFGPPMDDVHTALRGATVSATYRDVYGRLHASTSALELSVDHGESTVRTESVAFQTPPRRPWWRLR